MPFFRPEDDIARDLSPEHTIAAAGLFMAFIVRCKLRGMTDEEVALVAMTGAARLQFERLVQRFWQHVSVRRLGRGQPQRYRGPVPVLRHRRDDPPRRYSAGPILQIA